jgi:hypothetical protein
MVIDEIINEFGAGRVGIKISPNGRFNEMYDSDPLATFSYLLKELDKRKVAFVEIRRAPKEDLQIGKLMGKDP